MMADEPEIKDEPIEQPAPEPDEVENLTREEVAWLREYLKKQQNQPQPKQESEPPIKVVESLKVQQVAIEQPAIDQPKTSEPKSRKIPKARTIKIIKRSK